MNVELVAPDNPVLHQVCPEYTGKPGDLRETAEAMFRAMRQHGGIGLAAPQVGLPVRMFVMCVFPAGKFKDARVAINPAVESESPGSVEDSEGCLSYPGISVRKARPAVVKVSYTDLNGKLNKVSLYGMAARCFQHELDHLNGVTIHQ